MLNFTVGPVHSGTIVREIGGQDVPYFRTPEFSKIMKENEALIKAFAKAADDSRAVFITGSGTAAMEASVINTLSQNDKVLIVNGGSFGQRFVDICQIHGIPYEEISLDYGRSMHEEQLTVYENRGFTAFLVNIHETSTGVLYDLNIIADFCRRNHLFLIVDAISSFLADPIDMKKSGIDVFIAGSQKALACPPGISIIILSSKAVQKVKEGNPRSLYFNLENALLNGERGQTPFTPAVSILIQINARLKEIRESGGVESEIMRVKELAEYFRQEIKSYPFENFSEHSSNALTALHPLTASAQDIFNELKDKYDIWICPNGGKLQDSVFRVGHIGYLFKNDFDQLFCAFRDMKLRGVI